MIKIWIRRIENEHTTTTIHSLNWNDPPSPVAYIHYGNLTTNSWNNYFLLSGILIQSELLMKSIHHRTSEFRSHTSSAAGAVYYTLYPWNESSSFVPHTPKFPFDPFYRPFRTTLSPLMGLEGKFSEILMKLIVPIAPQ